MEIFKNDPVGQIDSVLMDTFGRVKLSGENTKKIMAKLIRKDFDSTVGLNQHFDLNLELIRLANHLELFDLAEEMISDLSFDSGVDKNLIRAEL